MKHSEEARANVNPEILGANLRHYRNARGLSQAQLADLSELSRVGYRNIESGASEPRVETLAVIARSLGVRVEDLLTPRAELQHVRFRAAKRLTTREDLIADVARWLGNYNRLEALLGAAGSSLVPFVRDRIASEGVRGDPVRAAAVARLAFSLEPRESVRDVCGFLEERVGVKMFTPVVASDGFFGLSVSERDGGPVVVVNVWDRISVERWIFTAIHELAHLLLHLDAYNVGEREEVDAEESEANVFASHFLMPEELFRSELEESIGLPLVDLVMKLKRMFRVSYKTVLYRLGQVLPVGKDIWRRYQVEHKRRHGRTLTMREEPEGLNADEFDGRPAGRAAEEPDRLSPHDFSKDRIYGLVRRALEQELMSPEDAAGVLRVSIDEFRYLQKSWLPRREPLRAGK